MNPKAAAVIAQMNPDVCMFCGSTDGANGNRGKALYKSWHRLPKMYTFAGKVGSCCIVQAIDDGLYVSSQPSR